MKTRFEIGGVGAALWVAAASASAQGTIKDYLYSHNAGPVAANDIIGVSKTVVSDLQAPRDLALSLGSFGDRDTTNGFGVSITPARSGFDAVAVSADAYRQGDWARRLWGGTTFSYAQNRKTIGTADYDQSALAVSLSLTLKHEQDPIVVAYNAFAVSEGARVACKPQQGQLEALEVARDKRERDLATAFRADKKRDPDPTELENIRKLADSERAAAVKALSELSACSAKAAAEVAAQWNVSRLQVMLGRGWIKPASGQGERLRLSSHAKVALALGVGTDGLFNLTWRQVADELDTKTLASMPQYKTTRSGAIRYTHKASKDNDLFAIAEASTLKAGSGATSQSDFKQALGLDKKVAAGLWLEFRYGRAHTVTGDKLENKALFALKFSPESTLEKQVK